MNGIEVAYERVGQGPPVVLVHGAASDSRIWRPQLAALSDEFTVVAWDEPGPGNSSDVPADFTLPDYARCLAALIDALEWAVAAQRRTPIRGRDPEHEARRDPARRARQQPRGAKAFNNAVREFCRAHSPSG